MTHWPCVLVLPVHTNYGAEDCNLSRFPPSYRHQICFMCLTRTFTYSLIQYSPATFPSGNHFTSTSTIFCIMSNQLVIYPHVNRALQNRGSIYHYAACSHMAFRWYIDISLSNCLFPHNPRAGALFIQELAATFTTHCRLTQCIITRIYFHNNHMSFQCILISLQGYSDPICNPPISVLIMLE